MLFCSARARNIEYQGTSQPVEQKQTMNSFQPISFKTKSDTAITSLDNGADLILLTVVHAFALAFARPIKQIAIIGGCCCGRVSRYCGLSRSIL